MCSAVWPTPEGLRCGIVPNPPEDDPLLDPLALPLPEEEKDDKPLDLLAEPDEDPLLDDPLPELEPEPLELEPEPDEWAVAGMSLWTHTLSAEKGFVPGMRVAIVHVEASMCSTVSTSSSASC
jgi:hypothetical protein